MTVVVHHFKFPGMSKVISLVQILQRPDWSDSKLSLFEEKVLPKKKGKEFCGGHLSALASLFLPIISSSIMS